MIECPQGHSRWRTSGSERLYVQRDLHSPRRIRAKNEAGRTSRYWDATRFGPEPHRGPTGSDVPNHPRGPIAGDFSKLGDRRSKCRRVNWDYHMRASRFPTSAATSTGEFVLQEMVRQNRTWNTLRSEHSQ